MIKKTLATALVATALSAGVAQAQTPASPHKISANVGLYSQYIFRGLTQTNADPAVQGGFDYSHSSGFYAGTWLSNISWLSDTDAAGTMSAPYSSSSLEWDFYGGFSNSFGKNGDFGYDVGLLYYYYPGTRAPGVTSADTFEIYGALSWKWLSAKINVALSNDVFGVSDADGTYYLDFTANYPVPNTKLNLIAHYGIQSFTGSSSACASGNNDDCASYEDWKLGASYALPMDFEVGAYYTDTSMDSQQTAFYTNLDNRELGKGTFTVYISKSF